MTTQDYSDTLKQRTARLEEGHVQLQRDVSTLAKNINQLGIEMRTTLGDLSHQISKSTQTQWPVLLGMLSIILIIIGMIGSGYVRDQNRHEAEIEWLSNKVIQHESKISVQAEILKFYGVNKNGR